MPKNRIVLQDGTIDLSGDYTAYVDRLVSDDKPLPYTVKEVTEAPPPQGFIRFLESDFTEAKTAETLIYYLSLIPAMETDFRLGGIFYGGAWTGKTAVLEIMREVFPGYFVNLPPEAFIAKKRGTIDDHYSPYIADLENRRAGIIQEFPADCKINISLWKVLTGGDTITARRRYHEPHDFIPTAQIIIVTNHVLSFPDNDDAVKARALIFPFLKRHDRGEGDTKTLSEIVLELKPEFPGIVHLMADRYIHLKRKRGGKIPQSPECRFWKKNFFEGDAHA
jgi:putative DNA primase/helicase